MDLNHILETFGIKSYELATDEERATLSRWMKQLESKSIGVAEVRQHIADMKATVEDALANEKYDKRQDVYLKARLRNYLVLEAFLTSPEKAKKALESYIEGKKLTGDNTSS